MFAHSFTSLFLVCNLVLLEPSISHQSQRYSVSDNKEEELQLQSHLINRNDKNQNLLESRELPVILWWTHTVFQFIKDDGLHKVSCENSQCLATVNRQFLTNERTRGIMFYGTDVEPDDLPFPRQSHHEWALFHEESPLNNYILSHNLFIRLFNHTATFRRESDFPLTLHFIPDDDYLITRKPVPLASKNEIKQRLSYASVVYIQSHCEVPSDRDRYVRELMKYIKIDSYGKCLNNKPIPPEFEDPASNLMNPKFLDFIAPYKFHLAIENAICEDYFTEKLMRTLHIGSIPVYKGSPSVKDWMPNNHSIILIDDFQSPKDLAEFIKKLDTDNEAYETYLTFKTEGVTNPRLKEGLEKRNWRINVPGFPDMMGAFECFLCDKLTARMEAERYGITLEPKSANRSHLGCPQPYTLLVDPQDVPAKDVWKEIDWIEMYWQAFDQALAVTDMIEKKEKNPRSFWKYLSEVYRKRHNL